MQVQIVKDVKVHSLKKSVRMVIIAALLCGFVVGGLSWLAAGGTTNSHEDGGYIIGLPSDILLNGTKLWDWLMHRANDYEVNLTISIVNGLLATFIFAISAVLWMLIAFAQETLAAKARARYGNDKPASK